MLKMEETAGAVFSILNSQFSILNSQFSIAMSLDTFSAISRALNERRPLAARTQEMFALLRKVVAFRDARLTCWLQSARPGALRQQFYARAGWPYAWDDSLTRQVALSQQVRQQELSLSAASPALRNAPQLPVVQAAYLGAPVLWGGKLWGVFELRAPAAVPLDGVLELVLALLPQLAAVIAEEGVRVGPASQNALPAPSPSSQLLPSLAASVLDVVGREMEEADTLQTLLGTALDYAMDTTGAEAGSISLVDHERGELALYAERGYGHDTSVAVGLQGAPPQRWSWGTGVAGRVARTNRAVLLRDVTQDPDFRPAQFYGGASASRAELAVPISELGEVLAVLVLDSPRSAAFGDEALAFVDALCTRLARPLRNTLRYQQALETSTQLGQVFSSLPTGLALLDLNGRVLRANPSWPRVWGLGEGSERNAAFHVPIDLVDALLPRLADPLKLTEFCAAAQRVPGEIKEELVRLNNPTRELQVLAAPTRDSQGQLTGRLWAVSDVTREREVDRLKNEFVSVVSHELRTPLTSILGYTELLMAREFEPEDRRQFVQTVYDQATHLSQLVEDLLNASRIEAGQVSLNRWVLRLSLVVGEMTKQLNSAFDDLSRHRLVIGVSDALPPVFVDRDKVKQILLNLLTNAVKYSPAGGEVALTALEARPPPLNPPPPTPRERGSTPLFNVQPPPPGAPPGTLPPSTRPAAGSSSACATAAWAFPPTTCRTSGSASSAWITPIRDASAAPGSACRSRARSSSCTAAASGRRANWDAAAPSRSRCPWRRRSCAGRRTVRFPFFWTRTNANNAFCRGRLTTVVRAFPKCEQLQAVGSLTPAQSRVTMPLPLQR